MGLFHPICLCFLKITTKKSESYVKMELVVKGLLLQKAFQFLKVCNGYEKNMGINFWCFFNPVHLFHPVHLLVF